MKSENRQYSRYFTYIKPLGKLPIIKYYGSTIFTLLTISLLTVFAIKPTIETILVLQKQIVNSNEILGKVTQKANDLSLGKTNYDNLDQGIKGKIAAAIPDTIDIKSFTQTLEQSAKNHEASISALQVQSFVIEAKSEDKPGVISEISFNFNTEGNYKNLNGLLQDLKTSGRLISIEHLSLSKTSDNQSLIMALSGKVFYLK